MRFRRRRLPGYDPQPGHVRLLEPTHESCARVIDWARDPGFEWVREDR